MQSWAEEELKYANLPDKRLNKRLIKIVENLAKQPQASVPQASGDWANTKATYNFWKSKRIELEDIIDAHQKQTAARASKEKIILAIQDTSDFNFTHHQAKTWEKGFGLTCSQKYVRGLKVHSIMASTTQGVPLGILDQQIWTRKPKTKKKKKNQKARASILNKESKRWLTGLVTTELAIPSTTTVVTVTDREGDIYELFALEREANSELLIRAKHNRRINHELKFVKEAIAHTPSSGQLVISVPRKDDQPTREANLTISYASFTFPVPSNRPKSSTREPITLNVISATEDNPPTGATPINWLLLTTLEVNNFSEAVRCVRWYTYRWLIERYHYVLKSGCRIEHLQLETAERIKKALATYAIVAWRLLWLTYQARQNPELPCDTILEAYEWQSLYCHFHHVPFPSSQPPSIEQAVVWIAQLGGFLARKHDGFPGVKTLWKGLSRLHDIASIWKLLHASSPLALETYG
ncbi:MAG: IS4 family transposase [Pleurocapsa sp. MO_226.B13]|nr:IS4 family transposase [Pleurocapsa sp. MO_226.B13]